MHKYIQSNDIEVRVSYYNLITTFWKIQLKKLIKANNGTLEFFKRIKTIKSEVRKLFFYLKNILKLVFAYFKIDPFILYFHLNPIWNALKKIKFTQKVKFTKKLNLIISRIEDEKKNI